MAINQHIQSDHGNMNPQKNIATLSISFLHMYLFAHVFMPI